MLKYKCNLNLSEQTETFRNRFRVSLGFVCLLNKILVFIVRTSQMSPHLCRIYIISLAKGQSGNLTHIQTKSSNKINVDFQKDSKTQTEPFLVWITKHNTLDNSVSMCVCMMVVVTYKSFTDSLQYETSLVWKLSRD